ncbi:hypothetical protein ILUMI_17582 [Ignelater luminosus]|uniref:Uncharacterized protein n=1 Tax=Ignelater luminosus TaxID=2038154 RepID=A0A8K0CN09_IGNLU|nr:hypothetical protein ILUMI_17582 [Ignelater luminosus]
MISVIGSNSPAGSSFKQIQHYTQLLKSKRFCPYDYGEKINLEIYGQASPPEYELNKITAPVAFYYGSEDYFCVQGNIDQTASKLPNLVERKCIEGFSHTDVLWGIDVVKSVFDPMIELMKKY